MRALGLLGGIYYRSDWSRDASLELPQPTLRWRCSQYVQSRINHCEHSINIFVRAFN